MNNIKIVPLSEETKEKSLKLLEDIFHAFDEEEDPYIWFKISLEPEKNTEMMKEHGVRDVRYFVVLDKDKVIGTTGLYHILSEPQETVWLGWFCLDPKYRGQGLGKMVLSWTIDRAREEGNNLLKLYTSPNENLSIAQKLYDKFGFKTTKTEQKNGETVIYKELDLSNDTSF